MATITAPFPVRDPVARPADGLLSVAWLNWFTNLTGDVEAAPARLTTVSLTAQDASIGTTSFALGALSSGLYRVSWIARVTQAATTSSSLTVTVGFTNGGQVCTVSGAAMTGNTVTTVQSETVLLQIDASTPLTYSTAYSSTGATDMLYGLWLAVERVAA
ncbi:MAG: hypothetical protein VW405_01000 [Rhodospirillaceae bacterium]